MIESKSQESKKNLAMIGVWHFECAVELFEKAIHNFERAKARGLDEDKQKEIEKLIKDCQNNINSLASQKESAGKLVN